MPTYEYRCKDCGHEFDIVQSFSDDALTECPVCEGALKKVYGNVGISFKGSGFYKNDARSSGGSGTSAKKSDSSSTSSGSDAAGTTSTSSDTKKDSATSSSGSASSD